MINKFRFFLSGDTTKFQLNGASLELKSSIDVDTEANQWSIEITVNDATPHIYATPTKIYVFVVITGIDDNVPVWHTDHNGIYTACEFCNISQFLFVYHSVRTSF